MATWINGEIIKIHHWTSNLFTLIVRAQINPFIAGQFTRLGLIINNKKIQRAYSYVNAPNNINLEFYITNVKEGKLTPMLHSLKQGNNILITKESFGTFIINKIPDCQNLWMIASGTGIGPYLSILNHGKNLERFKNIILIHATRFAKNLNYYPQMLFLQKKYINKIKLQIILSQENTTFSLQGRLPEMLDNGSLEMHIGLKLHPDNSHIMICGNPNMIYDTQLILKKKLKINNQNQQKYLTKERYW